MVCVVGNDFMMNFPGYLSICALVYLVNGLAPGDKMMELKVYKNIGNNYYISFAWIGLYDH